MRRLLPCLALTLIAADGFRLRMREHWRLATAAQSAVIQGDLPGAKAAAEALANLTPDQVHARLDPGLPRLILAARELETAGDLPMAGQAVAHLGATCGECHRATGKGPRIDTIAIPASEWSDEAHMPRHQWAADHLWLGLVGPSDEAWARGARELVAHPVPAHPDVGPNFAVFQAELVELATVAERAVTMEARAEVYGDLLSACSACHLENREAR